jgi:L-ribulose-5-phosphate 3-epimerase
MARFKIGVLSDGFRLPPKEGVRKAAELGAEGVQVYTVSGEMSPEEMDEAGRKDFRSLCEGVGVEISALCGDMGGGFQDPRKNPEYVERSKRIVDLAVDLGANVVTTHVGVVPGDRTDPTYQIMLAACREIAEYGAGADVTFAIETGPEKAEVLKMFLEDVDSKGLGVNLDPANLVMLVADDPVQAVRTLGDYVVHTHAKDGVQLRPVSEEEIGGVEPAPELGPGFQEVPLGEGGVQWDAYLDALTEIGYSGFLTVEREVGDDPAGDIRKAMDFLRAKIG